MRSAAQRHYHAQRHAIILSAPAVATAVAVVAEVQGLPPWAREAIATTARQIFEFLVSYGFISALALNAALQILLAVLLAILIDAAWKRASRDPSTPLP